MQIWGARKTRGALIYIYIYLSNILQYNLDSLSDLHCHWTHFRGPQVRRTGTNWVSSLRDQLEADEVELWTSNKTSHKISAIGKSEVAFLGSCLISLPRMSLPMAILTCTSDGKWWPVKVLWCPHMKLHTSHRFQWAASKYRQPSSSSFQAVICLRLVPGLDPGVSLSCHFLWKWWSLTLGFSAWEDARIYKTLESSSLSSPKRGQGGLQQ